MIALCVVVAVVGLVVLLGSGGPEPDVPWEPDDERGPE